MPVVGHFSEFFKTPENLSKLFDWTQHPKYPEVHDLQSYWEDHLRSSPEMMALIKASSKTSNEERSDDEPAPLQDLGLSPIK